MSYEGDSSYVNNWRKKHPKASDCHNWVNNSIAAGRLKRPDQCELQSDDCKGRIEAAHYDYDHPKLFRWLCKKHHIEWDKSR